MKQKVDDLIQLLNKEEVVKKIMAADDKITEYKRQKEKFKEPIKLFMEAIDEAGIDLKKESVISDGEYDISSENAIQLCLICMMAGIDDDDLLGEWERLAEALEEEASSFAQNIAFIISEKSFSNYEKEEDLLKELFYY